MFPKRAARICLNVFPALGWKAECGTFRSGQQLNHPNHRTASLLSRRRSGFTNPDGTAKTGQTVFASPRGSLGGT